MTASINNILLTVSLLLVLPWIAIFGGSCAVWSHVRGGSAVIGFFWGACLGPFGWLATFLTTRQQAPARPERVPAADRPDRARDLESAPRRGKFL